MRLSGRGIRCVRGGREIFSGLDFEGLVMPSVGPSYGRAMDQAPLLRKHRFPCALALPCGDPRDALR